MTVMYVDIKERAMIEKATGRAVIPEYDLGDESEFRQPDLWDHKDMMAIQTLHRRTAVLDAMNTIVRYANNENISMGAWLYLVEDGAMGIEMAEYTNDEEFFGIVELFKEIVTDASIEDLVW